MIGNIVNTVFSRIGLAAIAILLLLLNSNFLGSEGLGTVGLIALSITIYLLFANIICGSSLIYYAPRYKLSELFLFAYLWIAFSALLLIALFFLLPFLKMEYAQHIIALGVIQAAIGVHSTLLVGKKRIKTFNRITVLQAASQILSLCFFYFWLNEKTVEAFIYSTYIAYAIVYLYSLAKLFPLLEKSFSFLNSSQIKSLFHYGFYIQLANVSQLLNLRLSYLFLDFFSGRAAVGLFMPAIQLSEGLLLPAKSIGMVQYAKISNTKSDAKSALLSLRLLKLVVIITLPITLLLMLIPAQWFTAVLGDDFGNTAVLISFMSLGIVALAGEMILSRYFSGTGNQKINATSSTLGLLATLIAGLLLIPTYGLYGAAITSSVSYSCMYLFLFNRIIHKSSLRFSDFWIKKRDIQFMFRIVKLLLRKNSFKSNLADS